MLSVDVIKEKLQSALSIDRYIHTLGVAEEAQKLAAVYGDVELVKKAGICRTSPRLCQRTIPTT